MFKAMLMIVYLNSPAVYINDTRGPYNTNEECQARLVEITEYIYENHPAGVIRTVKGKCPNEEIEGHFLENDQKAG